MVALRSWDAEIALAEQRVDDCFRRGIRSNWQREALDRAQAKLRGLLAERARSEKPAK